jgi:hypothetical protein
LKREGCHFYKKAQFFSALSKKGGVRRLLALAACGVKVKQGGGMSSDISKAIAHGWRPFADAFSRQDLRQASLMLRKHPELGKMALPGGNAAMVMAARVAVREGPKWVREFAPWCDPMLKDSQGCDALMWAARMGSAQIVRELLPMSDPLARDVDGTTALGWALGDAECVEMLARVSDLDSVENDGDCILKQCAFRGSARCVIALDSAALARGHEWSARQWDAASILAFGLQREVEQTMAALALRAKERQALDESALAPKALSSKARL